MKCDPASDQAETGAALHIPGPGLLAQAVPLSRRPISPVATWLPPTALLSRLKTRPP